MTREEFGQMLRQRREERGQSLEDVSRKLKITATNLAAFESGDYSRMPHPCYVKGFLRTYAKEMGFLQEEYQDILDSFAPAQVPSMPFNQGVCPIDAPRFRRLPGILATVVFVGCLCGVIWKFAPTLLPDNKPEPAKPVAPLQAKNPHEQLEKLSNTATLKENAVRPSDQIPEVKTEIRPEKQPLDAVVSSESPWSSLKGNATIAGAAGLATQTPAEPVAEINPQNPNLPPVSATEGALPPKAHQVTVIAGASKCWLQGKIDGGEATSQTLQPGETRTFPYDTSLDLQLGHTRGVRVLSDGEELTTRRRHFRFPLAAPAAPVDPAAR